jgi:hypothetical protein
VPYWACGKKKKPESSPSETKLINNTLYFSGPFNEPMSSKELRRSLQASRTKRGQGILNY